MQRLHWGNAEEKLRIGEITRAGMDSAPRAVQAMH